MKLDYDAKTGELVIRVPIAGVRGTPSASGKTLVIGSTHGNKKVETPEGDIFVGANVYRYPATT